MLSDEAFNVIEDLVKVKSSPSAGGLKILLGCSFESSATTSAAAKMLKFSDTENKVRKQRRPKTPPHTHPLTQPPPNPIITKKTLLAPVALPRRPNFRTGQGNKLHLVSNVNVQGLHSLPPFAPRHLHDSVCEYDKRQGEILAPPPPLAPCQSLIHEHQPSCDSPPLPYSSGTRTPPLCVTCSRRPLWQSTNLCASSTECCANSSRTIRGKWASSFSPVGNLTPWQLAGARSR